MKETTYLIEPVPKPRMTQSDKWKKRKCVENYWLFKDQVAAFDVVLPVSGAHVIFYLPMPKSWSAKKKKAMQFQPHRQRPDVDNLLKALADGVYGQDEIIWDIRVSKFWDYAGSIVIKETAA